MNDEDKKLLHRDVINEVAWNFLEMMQANVNSIVQKQKKQEENMLREKLKAYIDANVPIIYVNSYDDNAVEESILKASGRRKVWEWNQMYGLLNRKEIEKRI